MYTNNIEIPSHKLSSKLFCRLEKTTLQPQAHEYLVLNTNMGMSMCLHKVLALLV